MCLLFAEGQVWWYNRRYADKVGWICWLGRYG